jgi:hypothetical protein
MERQPLLTNPEEEGISSYNITQERVSVSSSVPFDYPAYDRLFSKSCVISHYCPLYENDRTRVLKSSILRLDHCEIERIEL